MKNLFRKEMEERRFTAVVASHRMNELEDLCGSIAILHKGGVVTAGDIKGRAEHVRKFQCVFDEGTDLHGLEEELKRELDVIRFHVDGSFVTLTVQDREGSAREKLMKHPAVAVREADMTLEEIFIGEMEGEDYDIRKVLY